MTQRHGSSSNTGSKQLPAPAPLLAGPARPRRLAARRRRRGWKCWCVCPACHSPCCAYRLPACRHRAAFAPACLASFAGQHARLGAAVWQAAGHLQAAKGRRAGHSTGAGRRRAAAAGFHTELCGDTAAQHCLLVAAAAWLLPEPPHACALGRVRPRPCDRPCMRVCVCAFLQELGVYVVGWEELRKRRELDFMQVYSAGAAQPATFIPTQPALPQQVRAGEKRAARALCALYRLCLFVYYVLFRRVPPQLQHAYPPIARASTHRCRPATRWGAAAGARVAGAAAGCVRLSPARPRGRAAGAPTHQNTAACTRPSQPSAGRRSSGVGGCRSRGSLLRWC